MDCFFRLFRRQSAYANESRSYKPVGPLTSSEELSLNWRTEVTFGTILPTANMCPVQRERAAQTNRSVAAIPNPPQAIGDRVVRP
ncbi:unnamed protein product [Cuscuta campestris]|uniref:Uncharacterized protein n=1 Tax=Cuscuta campestris TaxID=132261 RepID=A0A484MML3_9ASTE|nr:unnamed protein product [Cuscuta campestris]